MVGVNNHGRWRFGLNQGGDPEQIRTGNGVWPLPSRWITPQDGCLWRRPSYRFGGLVAPALHSGRAFIAGDAAHQQPPFLGQGLCQGVRDVANLSWKLTSVLQGRASSALLDTYGDER